MGKLRILFRELSDLGEQHTPILAKRHLSDPAGRITKVVHYLVYAFFLIDSSTERNEKGVRKLVWLASAPILLLVLLAGIIALFRWARISPLDSRNAIYYAYKLPHPYVGYVEAGQQFRTPLWSKDPYSFTKPVDRSKIRVGILGGSVAHQLYRHWATSPEILARLQKILAARLSRQGEVELVELCSGGWYHPQTLIAALLYGRGLDLAISLEGANELVRGTGTFPVEFPKTRIADIFFSNTFASHFIRLFSNFVAAIFIQLEQAQEKGISPEIFSRLNESFLDFSRVALFHLDDPHRGPPRNDEAITNL